MQSNKLVLISLALLLAASVASGQGLQGLLNSVGNSAAGGALNSLTNSATSIAGGTIGSANDLVQGLVQDEEEMVRREIGVATSLLGMASERLRSTNSLGDLADLNLARTGQQAATFVSDSVRSLSGPISSAAGRITALG